MERLCPLNEDSSDDCKKCIYSPDYHLVNGVCTNRDGSGRGNIGPDGKLSKVPWYPVDKEV